MDNGVTFRSTQNGDDYRETFLPSEKSRSGKVRRWLLPSAVIVVGVAFATHKGAAVSSTFVFWALLFVLSFYGALYWFLGRRLSGSKTCITLDGQGIESPLFNGKIKRYPWQAVAGVSLETIQGYRYIQFQLATSQGYVDKRNFWNGVNAAKPLVPLSLFDDQEQEKIFASIGRCLSQSGKNVECMAQAVAKELIEEREFQEKMKALAPVPWMTCLLIAINVLVWVWTVLNGAAVGRAGAEQLLQWGGNAASEVQHGGWWRLLSAMFLHSGLMHVAMNMLGLASFGVAVERIYGRSLFLLIYLGSGLIGGALSLHFSAQYAVSVGASGAVFGIAGALLVGVYRHRQQLPKAFGKQTVSSMAVFIIYALLQGFAQQGIDNAAHIGGLLGGCLLALVLPERFDMDRFVRIFQRRAIAGIAIVFAVTAGLAALAPLAEVDQKRVFEGNAALGIALKHFGEAVAQLQQEQSNVKVGRLTERESDTRSRTVFAPKFRKVLDDFRQVYLAPSDTRVAFVKDVVRTTELMLESLEMESVYKEGSDKPEPIDPARMSAIEKELQQIEKRVTALKQQAPGQRKH